MRIHIIFYMIARHAAILRDENRHKESKNILRTLNFAVELQQVIDYRLL